MLHFITGNANKLTEIKALLPGQTVGGLDIDLPEVQSTDARAVIEAKLSSAFAHHQGPFIVEDTSLYLDALGGLPGPLIKWFLKALAPAGLAELAISRGNTAAQAKTIIGYAASPTDIHYFEGIIPGTIVAPRGEHGFGWDPIFQPAGATKTFAEMDSAEKHQYSMRRQAADLLAAHLDQGKSPAK